MKISEITPEWLNSHQFNAQKGCTIDGVYLKDLNPIPDDRGDVIELWSTGWEDYKSGLVKPCKHSHQSATDPGVIKAFHIHEINCDQYTVTRGKLQVVLADLRETSATLGQINSFILCTEKPRLLQFPAGIAHGWKALGSEETIVINYQTELYTPKDEYRLPWDVFGENIWGPHHG